MSRSHRSGGSKPSNAMDAKLANQRKADEEAAQPTQEPLPEEAQLDVHAELQSLRDEIARLTAERSPEAPVEVDGDELLYLARNNGCSWSERKVRDGKYVDVSFRMTKFFGPFETEAQRNLYLESKMARDSILWSSVVKVDGQERRMILRRERAQLEAQGAVEIPQ